MGNLNYGVIGNGRSAALVSERGSIEWCCLPLFDSPAVFAHILDDEIGGEWGIETAAYSTVKQEYIRKTNILVTTFSCDDGVFELIDFMPRHKSGNQYHTPPDVIRYLKPISGTPKIRVRYNPKIGYAQYETRSVVSPGFIKSYTTDGPYGSIYLYTNLDKQAVADGTDIVLDKERFMLLSYNQKLGGYTIHKMLLEFERTKVYWMNWVAESPYMGKYHDVIERSALVLKMLAYQKTGAVLAALTTSIPEEIGSVRNWDYRFCWIRDASMTIRIFTELGHYNVGRRYLQFVLDMLPYKDEPIQIMYGINGEKILEEQTLPWLKGYGGSQPVRIGNAAYSQVQNDIYGLAMDTICQKLEKTPNAMENSREELWTVIRTLVRYVEKNWRDPDAGIWEFRGENRHFVFSKVMCWLAVERAAHIAQLYHCDDYVEEWTTLKETIREDVLQNGWNEEVQAFTQSYGGTSMDASILLLEHYGFLQADDPRYVSTVKRIYDELCVDGLMYRYRNTDDFGEPTSSFTVCTFWMIKSLHRIGETERATAMFEELLGHGNHLGLFSEDIHFETKELLGNFPQGYSHLALIDTALALMGDSSLG